MWEPARDRQPIKAPSTAALIHSNCHCMVQNGTASSPLRLQIVQKDAQVALSGNEIFFRAALDNDTMRIKVIQIDVVVLFKRIGVYIIDLIKFFFMLLLI